jgi:hypothetical protein
MLPKYYLFAINVFSKGCFHIAMVASFRKFIFFRVFPRSAISVSFLLKLLLYYWSYIYFRSCSFLRLSDSEGKPSNYSLEKLICFSIQLSKSFF